MRTQEDAVAIATMLVDHALTRVARGLVGRLEVTGPENLSVCKDYDPVRSAHSSGH